MKKPILRQALAVVGAFLVVEGGPAFAGSARFSAYQPCPVDSADVVLEHEIRSRRHPSVDGAFREGFCWKEFQGEEARRRFLASRFHSVPERTDVPTPLGSDGHPAVTPESAKATFEWIFQRIGRGFAGVVGRTRIHSVAREGLRFQMSSLLDRPDAKGPVLTLRGEVVVRDTLAMRIDLQGAVRKPAGICQSEAGTSWCVRLAKASASASGRARGAPADRGVSSSWGVHSPSLTARDSGTVYFALPPEPFVARKPGS